MKKLSTEEKAKRYDEITEKFDVILNLDVVKESGTIPVDDVRKIIPELEDEDEKIRKAIYSALKYLERELSWDMLYDRVDILDAYDWLEKQGQVNETIISQHEDKICKENNDSLTSEDERIRKFLHHTFTVQYLAKDGLGKWHGEPVSNILAWLEKQDEQETDEWKEGDIIRHGGILALVIKGRRAIKSNSELFTIQYPKEWVKAAPNEIEYFLNELEKQVEQEPIDYNEELKKCRENPLYFFDKYVKVKPKEQKPAWSEEDEKMRKKALLVISDDCGVSDYEEISAWLKSLKDRVGCEANCTTTKEWSEEDEKLTNRIEAWLDTLCDYLKDSSPECVEDVKDVMEQLKSLRPQKQWKPSEKQMEVLGSLVEDNSQRYFYTTLNSLYEQLKQL